MRLLQEPGSPAAAREASIASRLVLRARRLTGYAMRFGVVGLLKTALDFAVFNVILLMVGSSSLMILVANTVGFIVAVSASFVLNARFTFRVRGKNNRFLHYVVVSAVGLLLYNGALAAMLVVVDSTGTLALNAMKVAALGVSLVWNFFGYWRFVFQPPSEAPAARAEGSATGARGSRTTHSRSSESGDEVTSQPTHTSTGSTN
jgi:putative flippase GtrA